MGADDIGLDLHFVPVIPNDKGRFTVILTALRPLWTLPRANKVSTGHLHSDGFESYIPYRIKKNSIRMDGVLFGGRYRTRTYDLTHCKRSCA